MIYEFNLNSELDSNSNIFSIDTVSLLSNFKTKFSCFKTLPSDKYRG